MRLIRRATAELVGTAFLVATLVGSGIAAETLSPNDLGLQLLENSLITGGALVALILALQPVSAAFNPVVTLVERVLGALGTAEAAVLIAAQVAGGALGAVVANLMFELPAVGCRVTSAPGTGCGWARSWPLSASWSSSSCARAGELSSPSPSAATSQPPSGSPARRASRTRP